MNECALTYVALAFALIACGGSETGESPTEDTAADHDFVIADGSSASLPALHGHYELSGALEELDTDGELVAAMAEVGFPSWRVSVARWEVGSLVASDCPGAVLGLLEPGQTLDDVLLERDWFKLVSDANGNGVADLEDTTDPANYDWSYFDRVLAVADAFGAVPYVSIDHMPRDLSSGTVFDLPRCDWTHRNGISNAPPRDVAVFASAALHFARHYLDGWGGGTARSDLRYWEIWNEADIIPGAGFWTGSIEEWMTLYAVVAVTLEAYRNGDGASEPAWQAMKIGGGSFANTDWIDVFFTVMADNDVPIEFLSLHGYDDDAGWHRERLFGAAASRDAADPRYAEAELIYAEWGLHLGNIGDAEIHEANWAAALQAATLLHAAQAGFSQTHRALFFDFFGVVPIGIVTGNHQRTLTHAAYRAYDQLAALPDMHALTPVEQPSELRYVGLASSDGEGVRAMLVQVGGADDTVSLSWSGERDWTVSLTSASGLTDIASGSGDRAVFALPTDGVALLQAEPR